MILKVAAINRIDILPKIYFAVATLLIAAELFDLKQIIFIFKPFLIPILMLLYVLKSSRKNPLYLASLVFALLSNIFFIYTTPKLIVYGIIAFMMYRLLTIFLVLKITKKPLLVPFLIATMPFIFIFSCLLNLTLPPDAPAFFPAVINGLLISCLAGISLSNYIMNDNKANSWFAISTLFFVVLVFLFMIQKYYMPNVVFQPISVLMFTLGHYTFYKFVIEAEKSTPEEIKQ